MELAPRLTEPANVFDSFVVTRGHFSAAALRSELDALGARLEDERGRTSEL